MVKKKIFKKSILVLDLLSLIQHMDLVKRKMLSQN